MLRGVFVSPYGIGLHTNKKPTPDVKKARSSQGLDKAGFKDVNLLGDVKSRNKQLVTSWRLVKTQEDKAKRPKDVATNAANALCFFQ